MSVEYLGKVNNIITVEKLKELTGLSIGINKVTGDITWLKFNDNGKILFACSDVIITNVSWNDLNTHGLIYGKEIVVNTGKFKCRSITGDKKNDSEWDRLIVNLVPSDSDSNWKSTSAWCQEKWADNANKAIIRGGGPSVDYQYYFDLNATSNGLGYRPVLEVISLNEINGVNLDIGDIEKFDPFKYTVSSWDNSNFDLVEKIDGKTVRALTNQLSGHEFTFNLDDFSSLKYGNHTIEIVASNSSSSWSAISKFNKVKSTVKPIQTNSNLKQVMLHNKELEKEISYQNFRLSEKLKEKGIEVTENENLSSLISKVKIGKKWAEGTFIYAGNTSDAITSISIDYGAQLDFNPSKIFLEFSATKFYVKDSSTSAECIGLNYIFCNPFKTDLYAIYSNYRYSFTGTISNITGSNFTLIFSRTVAVQNASLKWYAFE